MVPFQVLRFRPPSVNRAWYRLSPWWLLRGLLTTSCAIILSETGPMAMELTMPDPGSWVEALHSATRTVSHHKDSPNSSLLIPRTESADQTGTLQEEPIVEVPIHNLLSSEEPRESVESVTVIGDIYTDSDHTEFGLEIMAVLDQVTQIIQYAERSTIQLEGYCDDRQSSAYSLIIGERRAQSLAVRLQREQINPAQIGLVSYGHERPPCQQWSISCWEDNLRMRGIFRTLAFIESHNGCFVRIAIRDEEEIVRYLQRPRATAFLKKFHLADPPAPLGSQTLQPFIR